MTDTDLLNFDKYLFVTEIGSRMWGMADQAASPDSSTGIWRLPHHPAGLIQRSSSRTPAAPTEISH